ncbi:MAG TPA: hypothetical protein VNH18_32720 [Bryobacteraceae bacterium]|nr:hypothetical protein [Bryobacteraceae bacterium]
MSHLSRHQRVELKAALEEKERRRCARDPEYWLFKYVKTQDEHDTSIAAKPFPDKEYLRWMVRQWLATRQNLWEKSRQMMASWTFCALYLHDTQFISAVGGRRLNFIQSKKEEDSDALLRRCFFIYEHQEPWLKAMYPAEYSYCHLRFYRPGDTERKLAIGEMWGIPQGGDVLRQHTASGLFIDEGAFQPDLESSIRAAQPMLKGGGRIDVVSSAEPSYFQELVEGRAK